MNEKIATYYNEICVRTRERLNPIFAPLRRKKLKRDDFTIISNNCWGGHVYRYFGIPYNSPTIGMYIFTDDYIKFVSNLKCYIDKKLTFISLEQSRYKDILTKRGGKNQTCPIGLLGDIEIIFLHYSTKQEAYEKWERRKQRIIWDNLVFKISEQNLCTKEALSKFDKLNYPKKVMLVTKDYGFKSQVISKEYQGCGEITNDTTHFRRYINLYKLING